MEILKLIFRSLILLIVAAQVIAMAKIFVRRIREYRAGAEAGREKSLRTEVIASGIGLIVVYALFVFVMAVVKQ